MNIRGSSSIREVESLCSKSWAKHEYTHALLFPLYSCGQSTRIIRSGVILSPLLYVWHSVEVKGRAIASVQDKEY